MPSGEQLNPISFMGRALLIKVIVCFSGTIIQTGHGVTHFQVGDRVVTNSAGTLRNDARFGALQHFALTTQQLTAKVLAPFLCLSSCAVYYQCSNKVAIDWSNFFRGSSRHRLQLIWRDERPCPTSAPRQAFSNAQSTQQLKKRY
jgi:hypothetical protein